MQAYRSDKDKIAQDVLAMLRSARGMFAALDQSGGSTPAALAHYGIEATGYSSGDQMFELIHQMRMRVITAPAFQGDCVLAVILFAKTLSGHVGEQTILAYLQSKGIASFLKVDQGLEPLVDGAQLMKPIPDLHKTLTWARELGVVGTKMRTLLHEATPPMVDEAVRQQFVLAEEIHAHGLIPIVEIEVSTKLPDDVRQQVELYLRDALLAALDHASDELRVLLKLTIPVVPEFYTSLQMHDKVHRILALSGGFSRQDACSRLSRNPGIIASFSRAFLEDLRVGMSGEEWDTAIDRSINEVMQATRNDENSFQKEDSHE